MSQNEARSFHGDFVPFNRLCRRNVGRKCGRQLPFGDGAVMSYVVEYFTDNAWHHFGWYSHLEAANEALIRQYNAETNIETVWTLREDHPSYIRCVKCGNVWDTISPCAPCNATS